MVQLQLQLGIDDAILDASAEEIADALAGGVHLTRDALGTRLRDAGLPAEGQRLGVMLANADRAALVCSGAMQGRDDTYALVDERAPTARRLDRDEAVAESCCGTSPGTDRPPNATWSTGRL